MKKNRFRIRQYDKGGAIASWYSNPVMDTSLSISIPTSTPPKKLGNRLAHSIDDVRFDFDVISGWNKKSSLEDCNRQGMSDLEIKFRLKRGAVDSRNIASLTVGNMTTLVVQSVMAGGFNVGYTASLSQIFGSTYTIKEKYRPYLVGNLKGPESSIDRIFYTAWQAETGSGRFLETGGYPWATFFLAILLTSMFIWVVIVATAFLYPAIWLTEYFGGENARARIDQLPFTAAAIILSLYLLLCWSVAG